MHRGASVRLKMFERNYAMKKKRMIKILLLTVVCCQLFLSGCGNKKDIMFLNDTTESEWTEAACDSDKEATEEAAEAETGNTIYVYVCGAVKKPGVYEVPEESRVYELLQLAGGFTGEAAQESLNQARVVLDGEQLRVPTKEEWQQKAAVGEATEQDAAGEQKMAERVNLNTASQETLLTLHGIGGNKAQAIIAYRQEHGGFQSTEEIMNISGIGEHTYDRIKDKISVR